MAEKISGAKLDPSAQKKIKEEKSGFELELQKLYEASGNALVENWYCMLTKGRILG
jgi:hypothetical protein